MSQEQPSRFEGHHSAYKEPIKYGDIFPVYGELASNPISPQDAALLQTAETRVLGQTEPYGPAAVMKAAASINQRAGLVGNSDVMDIAGDLTVTETKSPNGSRIITESIGGQVLQEFITEAPPEASAGDHTVGRGITIGQALEASAIAAGDKLVDQSDADAIQAAEVRVVGSAVYVPGGVAAEAESAASVNARLVQEEAKTKLGDVLKNARLKLPSDKEVTNEDAEQVILAELRNNPGMTTYPGGVANAVAEAARMNQQGGNNI